MHDARFRDNGKVFEFHDFASEEDRVNIRSLKRQEEKSSACFLAGTNSRIGQRPTTKSDSLALLGFPWGNRRLGPRQGNGDLLIPP